MSLGSRDDLTRRARHPLPLCPTLASTAITLRGSGLPKPHRDASSLSAPSAGSRAGLVPAPRATPSRPPIISERPAWRTCPGGRSQPRLPRRRTKAHQRGRQILRAERRSHTRSKRPGSAMRQRSASGSRPSLPTSTSTTTEQCEEDVPTTAPPRHDGRFALARLRPAGARRRPAPSVLGADHAPDRSCPLIPPSQRSRPTPDTPNCCSLACSPDSDAVAAASPTYPDKAPVTLGTPPCHHLRRKPVLQARAVLRRTVSSTNRPNTRDRPRRTARAS